MNTSQNQAKKIATDHKDAKQCLLDELRSKAVGVRARRIIGARLLVMKDKKQITQDEFNYVMGIEIIG